MGAMRKAGVWLGLIEDEDDRHYSNDRYDDGFDGDDEFDDAEQQQRPVASTRTSRVRRIEPVQRGNVRSLPRNGGSVTPLTRDNLALAPQLTTERSPMAEESAGYRITTLHPTTYNEARTLGEHFRDGVPVIMNLSEMDESDAKRLVDFAAGLVFGLRGSFERVTNRVFLLSPANVQVTAEDKAKIAGGEFFNQS